MLPISELNRIRRDLVAELERQRALPRRWELREGSHWLELVKAEKTARTEAVDLVVLCRNLPQIEAAISAGAHTIYCDFEDPKRYREADRKSTRLNSSHLVISYAVFC